MTQRQRYDEFIDNWKQEHIDDDEECPCYEEWYDNDCKLAEEDWMDYYAEHDDRDEWDDYWDDVARSVGATPFIW